MSVFEGFSLARVQRDSPHGEKHLGGVGGIEVPSDYKTEISMLRHGVVMVALTSLSILGDG